jgi:transposase
MKPKLLLNEKEIRSIYRQGEEAVVNLVMALLKINADHEERIKRLEDQIAKNSSNSNKPPSSDGFNKPTPKSLRKRHGKKSGGQAGHQGNTLKAVEKPDHTEIHQMQECGCCQSSLVSVKIEGVEKRQVFDIPKVKMVVTEHQAEIKICPQCGEKNKGKFPEGISQATQYGVETKAVAVYFNQYQMIPLARTKEIIEALFGQPIAEASLISACQDVVKRTMHVCERIKAQITQKEDVVHFDETGVRVNGKLHWLHSASTDKLTSYAIHTKRGHKAMDDVGILSNLQGYAIHDGWQSYFRYPVKHGLCNVHHLRRLEFLKERYPQPWVTKMSRLLLKMNEVVEIAQQKGMKCLPEKQKKSFIRRYNKMLLEGYRDNPPPQRDESQQKKRGRIKQNPARNLLDELSEHKSSVLAFMIDFRVPFDNNQAERDVRMMKVKLKISGCFRTLIGAEIFCNIRGYISTARKNGVNSIDALRQAFLGNPYLPDCITSG